MKHEHYWRFVGGVALALLAVIGIDSLLEYLGTTHPGLQRSTVVWGTYSSWASAILPSIALLISVRMWAKQREADRMERLRVELGSVSLDRAAGYPRYLRNDSGILLVITAVKGVRPLENQTLAHPGFDVQVPELPLSGEGGTVLFKTPGGFRWSITAGSSAVPLDDVE